jgi:hypothetical protein
VHKASISIALAVLVSFIGTSAHSQAPLQESPPLRERPATPKLNLTLEQRHIVREFMKDMKVDATSANVQATIGDPIPQGISPQPMPTEVAQRVPQVKTHRFFLTAQQIVIVDPKNNTVADVIKVGAD